MRARPFRVRLLQAPRCYGRYATKPYASFARYIAGFLQRFFVRLENVGTHTFPDLIAVFYALYEFLHFYVELLNFDFM